MNILLQESKELVDAKGGDAMFDVDELAFVTPVISKLDNQVNEFLKVGPHGRSDNASFNTSKCDSQAHGAPAVWSPLLPAHGSLFLAKLVRRVAIFR
jgi:hypothetical protein